MNSEFTLLMTTVDSLIIALLFYVLIILFRHIPEARRLNYVKSVILMIAGVAILIAYLMVDLGLMHASPQLLSSDTAETLKTEIHLNWDWIIILIGFATISLGVHHLLNFANPNIVGHLEEQLGRELRTERELQIARNELEIKFMKRSLELENSETEARKAHDIIQTTFQNMEQGIIMLNADGEVLVFNDRFVEFSKITREEAKKCRTFQDFVENSNLGLGPENQARAIKLAMEGGDCSYQSVLGDGTIFEVRQRGMPGGGIVRTYTDITRFKEIEGELREAVNNLESATEIMRTTLENMGQGILMVDSKEQIVTYNDKVLEYLGKSKEAVNESQTLIEFFRIGEVDEAAVSRAMEFARSREKVTYELTTLDGKVLEIRQNPLEDGGWVRTYTNITGRKKAENELREARDQADASNKAKANFLATMSHEIRTPMNGVIGMVDLLSRHNLDTDQRHIVRTIRDSGYALLTIINDILDLSKIEAGKLELEFIEMSIIETVEAVAETLSTTAEQKDIRLITYVDPRLPDPVTGDPIRLRQILFNLVSNAIKFSAEGGEVHVLVESGAVSGSDGKNGPLPVRFTVIDSGIGISELAQQQLFQAFTQAEASTTRKYGGTGLGLSICHRLAEVMSGKISVTSREGEGSSFYLDLPFNRPPNAVLAQEKPLDGLRVLLAGANERQCQAAESYISYAGAETHCSGDVTQALAMWKSAAEHNAGYDVAVLFDDLGKDVIDKFNAEVEKHGRKKHSRLVGVACLGTQGKTFTLENGNVTRIDGNPLHRWKLIKAVAIAAGRASPFATEDELEQMHPGTIHLPTPEQALEQGTLVLVAEDNLVNQDVIRRQLNQLGYQCELAGNGVQALEMWKEKNYGIILSDCHMPEMDGYQLTRAIRDLEQEKGGKHTPIVAITANALSGEAERCLESGMDGYLSKPLKIKTLQVTLERLLNVRPNTTERERPETNHTPAGETVNRDSGQAIDASALKDEFGNDETVFKEILSEFLISAEAEFEAFKSALEKCSPQEVASVSHKMKSACKTVGALALAELYEVLERAGREANWELIGKEAPKLDDLMNGIRVYIESLEK